MHEPINASINEIRTGYVSKLQWAENMAQELEDLLAAQKALASQIAGERERALGLADVALKADIKLTEENATFIASLRAED